MSPPNDDLNTVQTLLDSGTNPNTLHRANTPLMWAAGEGYSDICLALLNASAETDILNAANYTSLMYAAEFMPPKAIDETCPRISSVRRRRL